MKVVFLDVDGVLNTRHTKRYTTWSKSIFVEPEMVKRVKRIVDETNAVVVLSSDWRYDWDDERYNQDYLELEKELKDNGIKIFSMTPEINGGIHRGTEIQQWINNHPDVKDFIILDDRIDMAPNLSHLFLTDMEEGLTEEITQEAIARLNQNVHYCLMKTDSKGQYCVHVANTIKQAQKVMNNDMTGLDMKYIFAGSDTHCEITVQDGNKITYDIIEVDAQNHTLYKDISNFIQSKRHSFHERSDS